MPHEIAFQGTLFASDFLTETITGLDQWAQLDDAALATFEAELNTIFDAFPADTKPNESQTEDDLIWKVLDRLGWQHHLRQQNLTAKGREDVPDGILFADAASKTKANSFAEEWKRYGIGVAIVESKRWLRPLDRMSGRKHEDTPPDAQMLRYLRRVDDLTTGGLRWGILTNGAKWRLYYQGARAVADQFFEIDLAAVLSRPGHDGGLFALPDDRRAHWLRVFWLMFRREAYLPSSVDPRSFHEVALEEGRLYEERVTTNLAALVFNTVYPRLAAGIANSAPDADLDEVREASLVLLYRLLFILYAEDRDLLPVRDSRYDDYGLRERVRGDIGARKDKNDAFSATIDHYWRHVDGLCRAIDKGDGSIGLPPYNGGLFDVERTPLLDQVSIPDSVMADVIDALSFELTDDGRRYINYRDLSVQQLGSIYERLLEYELVREPDTTLSVRLNTFARKNTGSYYTPNELVSLIIAETIEPLITARMKRFASLAEKLENDADSEQNRLRDLKAEDPAKAILSLKICDPAMGSGHFLVNLVDYLTDKVIETIAQSAETVTWADYTSPLSYEIDDIRTAIYKNAKDNNWSVHDDHLDDRHMIRRMVLKRCIYGVDKNPMAVELAKLSLWLHSFTVGAPLSFLDHHLHCGDSLFGLWTRAGIDKAQSYGSPLFLHQPIQDALRSAAPMQLIEKLTDHEIAEAHRSADIYIDVQKATAPLGALLSLLHAADWLGYNRGTERSLIQMWITGVYGDPIDIATGKTSPLDKHYSVEKTRSEADAFTVLLGELRALIAEERFTHWHLTFPGVWRDWEAERPTGGFDAVIGNPPWDRMKLQQVEWFAARRREIALAQRASDRKAMIAALEKDGDPLANEYQLAASRAEASLRLVRASGDYPLLSRGDVNLYSLFIERAMQLVKPDGLIGLLTPSGIASDKTAAPFFKSVATEGRLKAFYDFENRRTRYDMAPFFPDVDSRFKFCAFVASPSPLPSTARCAVFLQATSELSDSGRCFSMTAEDFARVNPNTGTAPIFRTRRDAELTTDIYARLPVLVDHSGDPPVKTWPVRYMRMFDMTNDSALFRTRKELEENEGAYAVGSNRWQSATGEWLPLYTGRMVHQFDHRAASVIVNPDNLHNTALSGNLTEEQKADPAFISEPQYWVLENKVPVSHSWIIAFRDIARATDVRTMIAAAVPKVALGNTAPVLLPEEDDSNLDLLLGNFGAIIFDYICRQKAQSTHLNWYIVEQLPVVPPATFDTVKFGKKTAGEIVREIVLELTYTAHDMAPFARDMGYVDKAGNVKPPFVWDTMRRLHLRAKLDALFFHLYGVTDRDDIRYIYSTFPIIARKEQEEHGRFLSCELALAWLNALAAGKPDAKVAVG